MQPLAAGDVLPKGLLTPFHSVRVLSWDEKTGTGRVEAVRRNKLDDWFFACHFLGDPVMPGCWGVDGVWQCLRYFAAWRGLPACRPVGMEDVRFFGQIRPHDKEVVYSVDVEKVEESEGDWLVSARAEVSVDGTQVYSIGCAQIGTALWQSDEKAVMPALPQEPACRRLSYGEFTSRSGFSRAEILAISQGTLLQSPPPELGLLPSGLMLEVGRVDKISFDAASGEGRVVSTNENEPEAWYYPMNGGIKPAALTIDAVWQLMGLFLSWRGFLGTGRALGFERVELFGEVAPRTTRLLYDLTVTKSARSEAGGDAFVRADAKVYGDGALILACANASVGCHPGIRYADYPHPSRLAFGGRMEKREGASR